MVMTVQDDNGAVADANSYIELAFFKSHHDDRGNDYSAFTDENINQAIIKATDYLDVRFQFVGDRLRGRDQSTAWPRNGAFDRDEYYVTGVPTEVKKATAEYALRALTGVLNPDPEHSTSQQLVTGKRSKVGPIEKETTFSESLAGYRLPAYPVADRMLTSAGLVVRGGRVARG